MNADCPDQCRPLADHRRSLKTLLPRLRTKYGVVGLGVFGSYARGSASPNSDLDVLVTYASTPSLFQIEELESELTDSLGIKVDVVPHQCLRPELAKFVYADLVEV